MDSDRGASDKGRQQGVDEGGDNEGRRWRGGQMMQVDCRGTSKWLGTVFSGMPCQSVPDIKIFILDEF
jgi:hypothetical protein